MCDEFDKIMAIIDFLGDNMSDEGTTGASSRHQCSELMDRIKRDLSIADRERLLDVAVGPIYTDLSMMAGEMGGFGRY